MSEEPTWLTRVFIDTVHADQLKQNGGLPGIRDENALESALARPRNRWSCNPASSLYELAAAYGYAFATSHPFSDANKRTAFIAMYTFLGLNGIEISAEQIEVVVITLNLAAGEISEAELATWLELNTVPFENE